MKNKILIGFITTLMVSFSGWVHSDTTEDLINALIVKGVLTEQEGNLLVKQAKAEKKNNVRLSLKKVVAYHLKAGMVKVI